MGLTLARFTQEMSPASTVLIFFSYSLLGFVMECIVLSVEKRRLITNRGFAIHMPFCIIYGFGGLLCYGLLSPLKDNLPALFIVGAVLATGFEFLVAQLQIRMFGDFWWDYHGKPFNYKGILCLESTFGWGIVAVVIVRLLHQHIARLVGSVPSRVALALAVVLLLGYLLDFLYSARMAALRRAQLEDNEMLQEKERI